MGFLTSNSGFQGTLKEKKGLVWSPWGEIPSLGLPVPMTNSYRLGCVILKDSPKCPDSVVDK